MIVRKTPEEIDVMAEAGEIVARCLAMLRGDVPARRDDGRSRRGGGEVHPLAGSEPAFKGYRGFPASICTSPNSMVVHGIPGHYKLSRGDVLSIDVGVGARRLGGGRRGDGGAAPGQPDGAPPAQGHPGVAARRCEQCRPGNRLGDVSHAVQERVERTASR